MEANANQQRDATMLPLMKGLQERRHDEGTKVLNPFSNIRGNATPMAWSGEPARYSIWWPL